MSDLPPAVPAATVIVVRDTNPGLEVLMLQRSSVGAFPGFWVFPGGRVDADDAGDDELSRAASAAVREAAEEVGVTVDAAAMHPLSHWTPPSIQPRRFATWFFVAHWQGDDVVIDGAEIVDHQWMSTADALSSGLKMAPPTIVSLHELHDAGSFAASRRREYPRYVTWPVRREEGEPVLLWQPDAGYGSTELDQPGPRHRLTYDNPRSWTYERVDIDDWLARF